MNMLNLLKSLLILLVASGSIPRAAFGEESKPAAFTPNAAISETDLHAFMQKWATSRPFEFPSDAKDEPLLLSALKKDPAGPWASYLGDKFATVRSEARKLEPVERADKYRATLRYLAPARETLKRAVQARPTEEALSFFLQEIELATALASLEAGENLAVIKERLQGLLRPEKPDDGDLVYQANSTLGRIALREDDVAEAKRRLIAAGETSGSPVLNSFGPDFILARELLERKELDAVLTFLDAVERFWGNPQERPEANSKAVAAANLADLEEWRKQIRAGKIPDDAQWK